MKTNTSSGNQPAVLITGYRGLAETLIEIFSNANYSLSVLVRDRKAQERLQKKYPKHYFLLGDVVDGGKCKYWVDSSLERFGRIDVLVNNAAVQGPGGKLNDVSFLDFRLTVDTDFLAPVRLIKFVLPHFLKQRSGVFINMSGGGALNARPGFSAYSTAKTALVRFTENLAHEYPKLRSYAVAPGALSTNMTQKVLLMDPQKIGKEFDDAKETAKSGGADPNEVAQLLLWLVREKPKHLNGAVMSAIWDQLEGSEELPHATGWWRLRRVDEVLVNCLKNEGL